MNKKLGVIGAGRIGRVHCENIAKFVPRASIKALADPMMNGEIAAFSKSVRIPSAYDDYRRIINDPEIDAVLICSPTNTHARISIEAAEAGKHIFCEKPVDTGVAEIMRVALAVERAGVKFQVGFNRRFDNNFKAIRNAVASGRTGRVHLAVVTSRDPAPPPPEYAAASGGIFMDMTIHDFDMIRYLTGDEPVEIYAAGAALIEGAEEDSKGNGRAVDAGIIGAADKRLERAKDAGKIDAAKTAINNRTVTDPVEADTAVVTVKLASGAIAIINNSRKAVYGYDQRAEVFGSGGTVSIANNTESSAVFSGAAGVISEKPLYFFLERYMQSYADEINSFVDAVICGDPVSVGIADGLAATKMALAAGRSLAENRPVRI